MKPKAVSCKSQKELLYDIAGSLCTVFVGRCNCQRAVADDEYCFRKCVVIQLSWASCDLYTVRRCNDTSLVLPLISSL